jgi:hypothetical protein
MQSNKSRNRAEVHHFVFPPIGGAFMTATECEDTRTQYQTPNERVKDLINDYFSAKCAKLQAIDTTITKLSKINADMDEQLNIMRSKKYKFNLIENEIKGNSINSP